MRTICLSNLCDNRSFQKSGCLEIERFESLHLHFWEILFDMKDFFHKSCYQGLISSLFTEHSLVG